MKENAIVSTIKEVVPAVVSIAISKSAEDLEKNLPEKSDDRTITDKNREKIKIPDSMIDSRGMVQVGGGSGFIVETDGIILTNKHVINDMKAEYTVILNDDRKFQGKVLSRDPINDVAILKIDADNLPTVKLGNAFKLELGEQVVAIGNALGIFKNTVSAGIVSGLSRSISAQAEADAPFQEMRGLIQTDAAINIGNSGGPLVNLNGEVVGVNAAIVFGAQNIGFAIPINAARRDLNDIKKYGRIKRPLLGVRYVMIDDNLKKRMNLPVNYGAMIVKESENDRGVVPESPAAKADLREKDIILEFNSRRLERDRPIQDFLEEMKVGDEAELTVLRDQKKFKITVVLAERK